MTVNPVWLMSMKGHNQEYSSNRNLHVFCHVWPMNLIGPQSAEPSPVAK